MGEARNGLVETAAEFLRIGIEHVRQYPVVELIILQRQIGGDGFQTAPSPAEAARPVRKGNEMPKFRRNVVYTEIKILIVRKAAADAVIHQKAEYALEDKEYGMFEDSLMRTSRIVRYLIDILDMQQPISRDLRRIYQYLIYDISRIKAGRERYKDEIGRVRRILSELKDAFDQASLKVQDTHVVQNRGILG